MTTDAAPIITNFLEGFHQGDDKDLLMIVYAPGTTQAAIDAETAVRQDITGYTFEFAIAPADGETALVSLTSGAGITITNAAQGEFTVALRNTHTATLAGRYRWAARRTNADARSVGGKGDIVFRAAATGTT